MPGITPRETAGIGGGPAVRDGAASSGGAGKGSDGPRRPAEGRLSDTAASYQFAGEKCVWGGSVLASFLFSHRQAIKNSELIQDLRY